MLNCSHIKSNRYNLKLCQISMVQNHVTSTYCYPYSVCYRVSSLVELLPEIV